VEFDSAIDTATVEIDGAKPSAEGRGFLNDCRFNAFFSQQTSYRQTAGPTPYDDDIEVLSFGYASLSHGYTS
jgi:hypothetical protein